ncbi:MAG: phage holin family protein [Polyangiaceae bacterium]|nr:phage holin family protein [Polyangiaceae bacterium]
MKSTVKWRHRAVPTIAGTLMLTLLAGCGSGMTQYTPQLRAKGELTAHYDNGLSMTAEGKTVSEGLTWSGLTEYVQCVPKAKEHAELAESAGRSAVALSWVGAGLGVGSFGSLAGLAVYEKDPDLTAAILGVGVFAAVTGVVLAAIGRNQKNVANGNAVDAMNYYNDAVGSYGGTCKAPPKELPTVEPTAKPKREEAEEPKPTGEPKKMSRASRPNSLKKSRPPTRSRLRTGFAGLTFSSWLRAPQNSRQRT